MDDATSYMLLEYCFAELVIILAGAIKAPKFRLPAPEWAVNKALDTVKARLKVDGQVKLTDYFPHSKRAQLFQDGRLSTHEIEKHESRNWLNRMSRAFVPAHPNSKDIDRTLQLDGSGDKEDSV